MHNTLPITLLALTVSVAAYPSSTSSFDEEELAVRSPGRWGTRIDRGGNVAGGVGSALSGVADIGNLIKGGQQPRKREVFDEEELFVRSPGRWGARIDRGGNVAGGVGSALSGVADIGNLIKGGQQPPRKRSIYLDDDELVVRSPGRWGGRIDRGANLADGAGSALSGIAGIGNLFRGGQQPKRRRDLEDLEVFIRSPGRWGTRIDRGGNVAGGVGSALSGVADIGNLIAGRPPAPKKRDLEGFFEDDVELFAREEFDEFDY